MDKLRTAPLLALVLVLLITVGCDTEEPEPTETSPTVVNETVEPEIEKAETPAVVEAPDDTTGVITGRIENTTGPITEYVDVWIIKLVPLEQGGYMYVLDTISTPNFPVSSDGTFQSTPMEPGKYVLVFGDEPERAVAIIGEGDDAEPFDIIAGQVVDIGTHRLALNLAPDIEDLPTRGYPSPEPYIGPSYP